MQQLSEKKGLESEINSKSNIPKLIVAEEGKKESSSATKQEAVEKKKITVFSSRLRVSCSFPKNKQFFETIAYWTICSSVAAKAFGLKKRETADMTEVQDDSGMKADLFGAADDANNVHNYLLEKGAEFVNQGKFEFSKESVSALSKEQFIEAIKNYFNSYTTEASIIFYSGHGFQEGKIMLDTSTGSYYLNYGEILYLWKKRTYPERNRHLLLILDCCYSGKWVNLLLDNGDFTDVSIQASSTDVEKSNDLGKGKGSLFTSYFLKANDCDMYSLDYKSESVMKKMDRQHPVSFGFRDVCRNDYNFKSLIHNSWQEMLFPPQEHMITFDSKVVGLFSEIYSQQDYLFNVYEHFVFVIREGVLSCQSEVLEEEKEGSAKYQISFKLESECFTKNTVGKISIYRKSRLTKNNSLPIEELYSGKYFNNSLKKQNSFRLREEQIKLTLSTLLNIGRKLSIQFKNAGDQGPVCIDDCFTKIASLYKSLTEMNNTFLILNEAALFKVKDDEESDGEDDEVQDIRLLNNAPLCNLQTLTITENIISDRFNLDTILYSTDNPFKSLSVTNSKTSPLIMLVNSIKTSLTLKSFEMKINYFPIDLSLSLEQLIKADILTELSLIFTKEIEFLKVRHSPLEIIQIMSLKKLKFVRVPQDWAEDIIKGLDIEGLREFHLESVSLSQKQCLSISNSLSKHKKLRFLTLNDCKVNIAIKIPESLQLLDLGYNNINNREFEYLVENLNNIKGNYSVNLEANVINSLSMGSILKLLKRNDLCYSLNISKNLFQFEFYQNYCQLINYCKSVSELDISGVAISNTDSVTNFLKNQKNIRTLKVVNCSLNNNSLAEFMKIFMIENSNLISYVDISGNKLTESRTAMKIFTIVGFRKEIETLRMKDCLDITDAKTPFNLDKLFTSKSLITLNLADSKCNKDFLITKYNEEEGLENLDLTNVNVNIQCLFKKKLHSLAINSTLSQYFSKCEVRELTIYQVDYSESTKSFKEIFKTNKTALNTLTINNFSPGCIFANMELDLKKLEREDSDEEEGDEGAFLMTETLIMENCDDEEVKFYVSESEISELVIDKDNIEGIQKRHGKLTILSRKRMIEKMKTKLSIGLSGLNPVISDEMLRFIHEKNKRSEYIFSVDDYVFANSPLVELKKEVKFLSLNANYFDLDKFVNTTFDLEALELNQVYIKSFLDVVVNTVEKHKYKIRMLVIRDSEINSPELIKLKELLLLLSDSLEELHLINTYIDGRESTSLIDNIRVLKNLKTLNLSLNQIDDGFLTNIIQYLKRNKTLDGLILRNVNLQEENTPLLFQALNNRKFKLLDLSGVKAGKNCKNITIEKVQNINYYQMRVTYNTKILRKEADTNSILCSLELNLVDVNDVKAELYQLLSSNKHLRSLNLIHCYREKEVYKLLMLIYKVSYFRELKVSGCNVNKKSAVYVKRMLEYDSEQRPPLIKLDMSHCQMEDESLNVLMNPITNSALLHLDISYNMMTEFSLISLLDQVLIVPEENRKNIQIIMNQSFSGLLTNDLHNLDEIMKFERSLKINSKILEQLKAKKQKDDNCETRTEEVNEEEDRFKNSIDKGQEERSSDSDSSMNEKDKKLLDYEEAFNLNKMKIQEIRSFENLYLNEEEILPKETYKEKKDEEVEVPVKEKKERKKELKELDDSEESEMEETSNHKSKGTKQLPNIESIEIKSWYNHDFEISSNTISKNFAGNKMIERVILIDESRVAISHKGDSTIDIYNFQKSLMITSLEAPFESKRYEFERIVVGSNTLIAGTGNHIYFWDLTSYRLTKRLTAKGNSLRIRDILIISFLEYYFFFDDKTYKYKKYSNNPHEYINPDILLESEFDNYKLFKVLMMQGCFVLTMNDYLASYEIIEEKDGTKIKKRFKELNCFDIKDEGEICYLKEFNTSQIMGVFNQKFIIWDVKSAQRVKEVVVHGGYLKEEFAILSPNLFLSIKSTEKSSLLAALDFETGKKIKYLEDIRANVQDEILSVTRLEGNEVLVCTKMSQISILHIKVFIEGKSVIEPATFSNPAEKKISSVALIKENEFLVGYETGKISVWSSISREVIKSITAHEKNNPVTGILTSYSNIIAPVFYTFSEEETVIKIWNLLNYKLIGKLEGFESPIKEMHLLPEQNHLIACNGDLIIYDITNRFKLKQYIGESIEYKCHLGSGFYLLQKDKTPFIYDSTLDKEKVLAIELEEGEGLHSVVNLGDSTFLDVYIGKYTFYRYDLKAFKLRKIVSRDDYNISYENFFKMVSKNMILIKNENGITLAEVKYNKIKVLANEKTRMVTKYSAYKYDMIGDSQFIMGLEDSKLYWYKIDYEKKVLQEIDWNEDRGTGFKCKKEALRGHYASISSTVVYGNSVFTGSEDGIVKHFNLANSEMLGEISLKESSPITYLSIVEEDRLLVKQGCCLWIYDIQKNYEIVIENTFIDDSEVSVTINKNTMIYGTSSINLISIYEEEPYKTIPVHDNSLLCITPHYNNRVITGGLDRYIAVTHLVSGKKISNLYGHTAEIRSIVSLNEDTFSSCSIDGTIRTWSLSLENCTGVYETSLRSAVWQGCLMIFSLLETMRGISNTGL